MSNYIYSINEDSESWYDYGFEEVANEYVYDGREVPDDGIVTIYRGVIKPYKAGDFFHVDLEAIAENALLEADDHAEAWVDDLNKKSAMLTKAMTNAFQLFCDENDLTPNFFKVINVKPVKVKIALYEHGGFESAELLTKEDDGDD